MRRLLTFITATAAAAALAAVATVAATANPEAAGGAAQSASEMASCASLASLALPNTTITGATLVEAGAFAPPGPQNDRTRATYGGLPQFCRV